ncbi:MAG: GTPase/DUF3482 domain-containing protein [Chitinophagaceae bacterium]|nr:GTPase/DUF3482 domain-containing protein [Oligoflexus sp.]
MIPSFAVVGRTNKGKSSLVATLIENDRIAVAATPRTTTYAQGFTFKINDKPLFTVFDTPGFEEAPAILEWLKSVPVPAHERRARVLEFYRTFHAGEVYRFECELLKPILDGASILYVADASHPYRSNFESEFEILQWTGQPSIALLNQIGEGHYEEEWKRALEQYFRKVLPFNAHTSWARDRIGLLEELKFLSDTMREPLALAIAAMRRQLNNRLRDSALVIADLVQDSLSFEIKLDPDSQWRSEEELSRAFFDGLRALETKCRQHLASIFGFHDLNFDDSTQVPADAEQDLFSKDTWEILGLSRKELLAIGTASGAIAGGTVDAMVGGASFMVGTGIGGLIGSLSSAYLAFSDPEIAGFKLGRKKRTMGPYKNPNFPWVLVDRQITFVNTLLQRTHAQREAIHVSEGNRQGSTSHLRAKDKTRLGVIFQSLRWNVRLRSLNESLASELTRLLLNLLTPKPSSSRQNQSDFRPELS